MRGWGRLAVRVMGWPVRQMSVIFRQVRRWNAVSVGVVGGGQVWRVLGLGCPHVAMVNVRLEVTLGKVCAFATRHYGAHPEGATLALFDPLYWVGAAVECQAGAQFVSLLLMQQGAVVAEHVFTGDHSSIQLNGQPAFVTEMDW